MHFGKTDGRPLEQSVNSSLLTSLSSVFSSHSVQTVLFWPKALLAMIKMKAKAERDKVKSLFYKEFANCYK